MGLIENVFSFVFGSGRNVLRETAEVFRPNAGSQAQRDLFLRNAALTQYAQEFYAPRRTWFDRLMDGLNRVPRPAMALGTLGLFVAAMVDPAWFSERMIGIALVPEPLWWLLGAIVSFYFGARHQAKGQEFQRDLANRLVSVSPSADVVASDEDGGEISVERIQTDGNAALKEWLELRKR